MLGEVDARLRDAGTGASRPDVGARVWRERLPDSEEGLAREDLAFFTYRVGDRGSASTDPRAGDAVRRGDLAALAAAGVVVAEPIVYEDFLPRSAAGIFASNLAGASSMDVGQGGAERDLAWMSDVVGVQVAVPEEVYAAESRASVLEVGTTLGVELG
jgi:uncharacterized glyoxalase superfamily metalloenzyme YdcJ